MHQTLSNLLSRCTTKGVLALHFEDWCWRSFGLGTHEWAQSQISHGQEVIQEANNNHWHTSEAQPHEEVGWLDDLSGVLATDITYIQLMNREWVYLATVYDPEKRRVVSYGLSPEMTKEFATSVVVKALRANGKPNMIHSDMGSQYTSSLFEGTLQNSGIHHSYSRKGHPYDNARIESFHSLIKREMIYHEEYGTIDDVRVSVEWYVNWYNNSHINSRTDWLQTA